MATNEVSPTVNNSLQTESIEREDSRHCPPNFKFHPACLAWPLADEDLDAMMLSIATSGQKVPILRWRGQIIDGRTRLLACERIDREPIIKDVDDELADDAAVWDMVLCLNKDRRHLTRVQLERVIQERLKASPDVSSRQVGKAVGVDHKTVERQRTKLQARGEIPHVSRRKDTRGRHQPARKPPRTQNSGESSIFQKAYATQQAALQAPETADDAAEMPANAEVNDVPQERRPLEESDLITRFKNFVDAVRSWQRKNGLHTTTRATLREEDAKLAVILRDPVPQEQEGKGKETGKGKFVDDVPNCIGLQFARMAIMDLEQIRPNDTEKPEAWATVKEWLRNHADVESKP